MRTSVMIFSAVEFFCAGAGRGGLSWGRGLLGRRCVSEAFRRAFGPCSRLLDRGRLGHGGRGRGSGGWGALLLGAGMVLIWRFFPLVPSREPGASPIAGRVSATAVGALCRNGLGLFAKVGVVKFATFDAFRGGMAVPLGMVEPLAAVALGSGPLFVGPLDGDQKVTYRFQLKNFSLVFWDFDQNEREGLFGPGGDHPGHLFRRQTLILQVGFDVVDADFHRHRSEHGSECLFLGEGEGVKGPSPSPRRGESLNESRRQ
jgi:hypothetical protein